MALPRILMGLGISAQVAWPESYGRATHSEGLGAHPQMAWADSYGPATHSEGFKS